MSEEQPAPRSRRRVLATLLGGATLALPFAPQSAQAAVEEDLDGGTP
ncbi:hypothetical protein [Nocardioides sp. GY 10127]|nr:hypothetical protein [Nocardioides sp. GY 10127]